MAKANRQSATTPTPAIRGGQAVAGAALSCPVRPNLEEGRPSGGMGAGALESGSGRGGSGDPGGGRRSWRGANARRSPRRAPSRSLPAVASAAEGHPEARWRRAATGHTDGPGPGGAAGGEAGVGADLRGGLSRLVVRLPAEAERD